MSLNDGYTQEEYIKGRGPHRGFTFHFRPALAERAAEYQYDLASCRSGKERFKVTTKLLAECVGTWDRHEGEKPIPATVEGFRTLPMPQMDAMVGFVTGYGYMEMEEDAKNSSVG